MKDPIIFVRTFSAFLFCTYLSACTSAIETIDSVSLSTDLSKRMLYSETGPSIISFGQCESIPIPTLSLERTDRVSCATLPFGDALIRAGRDCATSYCETYYTFSEGIISGKNVQTVRKIGKTRGQLIRDDFTRSLTSSSCYKHKPWPRYRSFSELISLNDGSSWLSDYGWNYIVDLEGTQCAPVVLARSLTVERK